MDEDWISITDAASRLTDAGDKLDRSTLSRYLKQHAEALPLRQHGKSNLVDFNALAAHRGENIRIRSQPPGVVYQSPVPPLSVAGTTQTRFARSQADGTARKANADAEIREMDLARRKRQLTPLPEVDKAGRDAVALMMSAYERAIDTEAASASLKNGWDERKVRIALKSFMKFGLDVFHDEVLKRLDELKRPDEGDIDPALSAE